VPKPRGSACFAQEAFPCFGVVRDAGVDDLESHVIAQDGVKSLKRDAHRPSAQLHWRAVATGSDLVMVKLLDSCSRNFLLIP
jgi:hypothetical protein